MFVRADDIRLLDEREQYIRDNAVELVRERDWKIVRQRDRIARLEKAIKSLRFQLKRERERGAGSTPS